MQYIRIFRTNIRKMKEMTDESFIETQNKK